MIRSNLVCHIAARAALSAALLTSACAPAAAPRDVQPHANAALRVIALNDFHGHLLPEPQSFANGARVGGAAELAAYIERERAAFTAGPTLILDGGDVMQGTPLSNLVEGRSTVDVFNAIGYNAVAVGNHEFDWGQKVLSERVAQAKYPWLSANIAVTGSDTAPSWAKPTAIVRAGNLRIGVIGLTTQETPQTTQIQNISNLTFTDGAAAMERWVPELRRQNVDFVIVVAHSGGSCDSNTKICHGEIFDWLSRAHAKPDMVVAGHTHTVIQATVAGVPVVEAGSYGNRYNVVDLRRIRSDSVAADIAPMRVVYADSIAPDARIRTIVDRVRVEVGPSIDRVIANAAAAVTRGGGESPAGRLIADGWRWNTGAQIAFMNTGGVRAAIDAGPITWGDLFSVHPFENRLVVLTMTGAHIRGAIEHAIASREVQAQVSGLKATYDMARPVGGRLLTLTLEDGTPIRDDATYTVVTSDFLATGVGDGFTDLGQYIDRRDAGLVDLDALIRYVQHLGTVTPPNDARLRAVGN